MTKTLEAFCKARGYQGGHIFMMIEEIESLLKQGKVNRLSDPYKWGTREGKILDYGYNIACYPVPVNSWEDRESSIEYIAGLHEAINAEWEAIEFGAENDYPNTEAKI